MNRSSLVELVELLPDAALLLGRDGFVEAANELAAALLRIPLSDLQGSSSLHASCVTECWYAQGSRRVRFGEVTVDIAVRRVDADDTLSLAILRDARSAAEEVIDAWKIGVVEHDMQTDVIHASPRLRELLAFGDATITPDIVVEAFHPDDRPAVRAAMLRAKTEGDPGKSFIGRTKNGRWVRARTKSYFAVVDGERRAVRAVVSAVDVTKQQHDALMLQRHKERINLATDVTGVGIFDRVILPEPLTPHWSESMRKLLGYDLEAPASVEWFSERVHPDDAVRMGKAIEAADHPSGDGRVEISVRWLHPDGNYRQLLIRSSTLHLDNSELGVKARSLGAILDITAQSAAEDELRSRTAILDATPDFVGIANEAGQVTYLNKAARAFWGVGEFDPVDDLRIGELHSEESRQRLLEVGMPTVRREGVWTGESQLRNHEGKMVPMSQVILLHRPNSGGGAYYSVVARDLSAQKLLEEQYRQSQKMEAIGRLAGGVAHDFNNLLSVIMGSSELALMDLSAEHPAREEIGEVVLAAERAAGLTRQLLAFGRKQILQPRVLDLNHVLYEMTPMLNRLVDESIQVQVRLFDQPVRIRADHTQVQQILLNLVVNAKDAMPTGGVLTLEALKRTLSEDESVGRLSLSAGEYSVIAVSDTGCGMDAETQKRIFEPFFTTKAPGRGTGLGLATVFGIARQSGGSIWVYSEVGQGTTFKIYLPSSDDPVDSARKKAPARVRRTQTGVILLAEDDDQLRRIVTNTLRKAGYEVLTADACVDVLGVGQAYEGKIDLLVTDVVMPGISGKQLADSLRESRPDVAVLYMSGYTENTIVHHGVLDEGLNFLPKPITPTRLLSSVEEVLGQVADS